VTGQLAKPQRIRTGTFSASATGRCERQQILRHVGHPEQEGYDPILAHRLEVGRWGHLRWQAQGLAAGWLKEAEVPVKLAELGLTGTLDGLLDDDDFGWEFKTIRHPGFNTVLSNGEPKFEHILQVTAYMLATGKRHWSVIYESTFSGEWKEFVVDFNPDLVGLVEETLARMAAGIENRELPPVLDECLERMGQYRDCPFRKDCLDWNQEGRTWPPSRVLRIRAR
jgi:hypothetical protein